MAAGRALSLSEGRTASSRSTHTTPAPAASALGNISGLEAGTNSRLRHGLILRALAVLLELSGQIIGVLLLLSRSTSLRAAYNPCVLCSHSGLTDARAKIKNRCESGTRALQGRDRSPVSGNREPADERDHVRPVSGGFDTA